MQSFRIDYGVIVVWVEDGYWNKEKCVRCILEHHIMGFTIDLIGSVKKRQAFYITFYNSDLSLGGWYAIYWDGKTGSSRRQNIKDSILDMSILYCLWHILSKLIKSFFKNRRLRKDDHVGCINLEDAMIEILFEIIIMTKKT